MRRIFVMRQVIWDSRLRGTNTEVFAKRLRIWGRLLP